MKHALVLELLGAGLARSPGVQCPQRFMLGAIQRLIAELNAGHLEHCGKCDGSGRVQRHVPHGHEDDCPDCGGVGRRRAA